MRLPRVDGDPGGLVDQMGNIVDRNDRRRAAEKEGQMAFAMGVGAHRLDRAGRRSRGQTTHDRPPERCSSAPSQRRTACFIAGLNDGRAPLTSGVLGRRPDCQGVVPPIVAGNGRIRLADMAIEPACGRGQACRASPPAATILAGRVREDALGLRTRRTSAFGRQRHRLTALGYRRKPMHKGYWTSPRSR